MKIKENVKTPNGQTQLKGYHRGKAFSRDDVMNDLPDGVETILYMRTSVEPDQLLSIRLRNILELLEQSNKTVADVSKGLNISIKVAYTDLEYLRLFGFLWLKC